MPKKKAPLSPIQIEPEPLVSRIITDLQRVVDQSATILTKPSSDYANAPHVKLADAKALAHAATVALVRTEVLTENGVQIKGADTIIPTLHAIQPLAVLGQHFSISLPRLESATEKLRQAILGIRKAPPMGYFFAERELRTYLDRNDDVTFRLYKGEPGVLIFYWKAKAPFKGGWRKLRISYFFWQSIMLLLTDDLFWGRTGP